MKDHLNLGGVNPGRFKTKEFVHLPFKIRTQDDKLLGFKAELHVLDYAPYGILLGQNWLIPYGVQTGRISSSNKYSIVISNHKVRGNHWVNAQARQNPSKERNRSKIVASKSLIVSAGTTMNIPISTKLLSFSNNGYLVESTKHSQNLSIGEYGRLASAVVDDDVTHLPFANLGTTDIKINKGTVIGQLLQHQHNLENAASYFATEELFGDCQPPLLEDPKDDQDRGMPFILVPPEQDATIEEANISDSWSPKYQTKIKTLLYKHRPLFDKALGRFNDGVKMPIPFKSDADLKRLKLPPFSLSLQYRKAADDILDPLVVQGRVKKVPLGKPSAAASPAFIIWKNDKPRLVVDLRRINAALCPDAYPLPKQDDISATLGSGVIFSSLDITKGFFQQDMRRRSVENNVCYSA